MILKIRYRSDAHDPAQTVWTEVPDDVGAELTRLYQAEDASEKRHMRHETAMWTLPEDGHPITAPDPARRAAVRKAFARLSPTQKRRVRLRAKGMRIPDIARSEGVSEKAVYNSIYEARDIFATVLLDRRETKT